MLIACTINHKIAVVAVRQLLFCFQFNTTMTSKNDRRPLTQQELEDIIADISDVEVDDKSDISEEDIIIQDYRQESEDESDDDNVPLLQLQQRISKTSSTVLATDKAAQSTSTTAANLMEQNNYLHIEEVPAKFSGKNGFKWSGKVGKQSGRTARRNLVIHLPGNKGASRCVTSGIAAWSLFFTDDILNTIVSFTNAEIRLQRKRYARDRPTDDEDVANTKIRPSYVRDTNLVEIKALCGIYYYAGALNMNSVTTKELFNKETGIPFFRAIMSEARFSFLTNCLRFDDKDTRIQRRETDRFAPIRDVFEAIISKCSELYTPSEYCTLDEQLVSFRGRCPFKMYIPSKPDKYGIKMLALCDSKTFYLLNAEVYIGKNSTPQGIPVAEYYTLNLTKPIHGTNRNLTTDNWFTSIQTAKTLHDDYSTTLVGTIKKNKAEIPESFIQVRGRQVNSGMFAYSEYFTLLSYCPPKSKQKKVVLLLSTMHPEGDKPNSVVLPEIIDFYNRTKGGVDTFDQLAHRYTVARKTRRWPLRIFYNLLDIVGINSNVLHKGSQAPEKESIPNRRSFLKNLARDLVTPLMRERLEIRSLPVELRVIIGKILNIKPVDTNVDQRPSSSGRCTFCERKKDRKSRVMCKKCKKFICLTHQTKVCPECIN